MQLPTGLDEIYERILNRAPKDDIEVRRKVLFWFHLPSCP